MRDEQLGFNEANRYARSNLGHRMQIGRWGEGGGGAVAWVAVDGWRGRGSSPESWPAGATVASWGREVVGSVQRSTAEWMMVISSCGGGGPELVEAAALACDMRTHALERKETAGELRWTTAEHPVIPRATAANREGAIEKGVVVVGGARRGRGRERGKGEAGQWGGASLLVRRSSLRGKVGRRYPFIGGRRGKRPWWPGGGVITLSGG